MNQRLPDFLIIGAMKSGTTTLYEYLERHPQVFMATPKEPNFFSMDEVYQKGADWYASLFAEAGADQLCGEASPSYSRFPRFPTTASRIAQTLPETKILYIMRHPVERFYSNYVFDRSYGFKDSIRDTLDSRAYVLETSNYMLQIEKYLEHFSREQMYFLLLEDLKEAPGQALSEVSRFLGVRDTLPADSASVQANPQGRNHVARQCNTGLQKFRSIPGVQTFKRIVPKGMRGRLRDSLLNSMPDSRLGRWISRRHVSKAEPLTAELRKELLERLAEPTSRLEHFLGRDLSAWRV